MQRNIRKHLITLMSVFALIAIASAYATAQCVTCKKEQPKTEKLEVSGYIENLAGDKILVKTASEQLWLLQVTRETQIQVTGTAASPEILKPGMSIGFSAVVDKNGVGQQPVEQLTIFTPTREQGYGAVAAAAMGGVDGMAGLNSGPQNFGDKPKEEFKTYTIAGKLTSYKNDKAIVNFGRGRVTVEISPTCAVAINVSDPSIVKKGDSIEAVGKMPAGQTQVILQTGRGMGRADKIEVQMAKPLEPPKKRSTIYRPKTRPATTDN